MEQLLLLKNGTNNGPPQEKRASMRMQQSPLALLLSHWLDLSYFSICVVVPHVVYMMTCLQVSHMRKCASSTPTHQVMFFKLIFVIEKRTICN